MTVQGGSTGKLVEPCDHCACDRSRGNATWARVVGSPETCSIARGVMEALLCRVPDMASIASPIAINPTMACTWSEGRTLRLGTHLVHPTEHRQAGRQAGRHTEITLHTRDAVRGLARIPAAFHPVRVDVGIKNGPACSETVQCATEPAFAPLKQRALWQLVH